MKNITDKASLINLFFDVGDGLALPENDFNN
jgi:hypothetical protein